jgi:NADH-quinone oxidoreductase subunit G
LYVLAASLAEATGAKLSVVPGAVNSVGAQLAGAVPHLQAGGKPAERVGLDALSMLKLPRRGYLLLGVEPGMDFCDAALSQTALQSADTVVAISAYRSPELEACCDILLPMALFSETFGTYVNAEGVWQQSRGAVKPQGEARPAWKILRVLGNLLNQEGFDYVDPREIGDELRVLCEDVSLDNKITHGTDLELIELKLGSDSLQRGGDTPLYATDPLVRRATALQQTKDAGEAVIRLHPNEAKRQGLNTAQNALVKQNGYHVTLPVSLDESIPEGCVWISTGLSKTAMLGQPFGEVIVEKA